MGRRLRRKCATALESRPDPRRPREGWLQRGRARAAREVPVGRSYCGSGRPAEQVSLIGVVAIAANTGQ